MTTNTQHKSIMPWEEMPGTERKLNVMIVIGLFLVLLMYIVIPLIELPEQEVEEIPERFAQLIVEEEPEVVPPQPVPEEEPVEEEEPIEEEVVEEEEIEEVLEVEEPEVVEKPEQTVEEAKEVAQSAGLMEFADSLAAMRNTLSLQNASANMISANDAQRKVHEGSDLNTDLTAGSGGVDTAKYTANTGVTGDLGARGKGRVGGSKIKASGKGSGRTQAKTKQGGRSNEQIYLANQRVKGALDRIYNKARRSNPDLEGTVTFKVSVSTSGAITAVDVVKSTIDDTELEAKLKSRLKLMANYGPGIVEVLEFSIIFTP